MRSLNDMFSTGIYTNEDHSLAEVFKCLIDSFNDPELCLYSVVGYFRSSGYFPLKESLKKLKTIKVVVGINADALSVRWHKESQETRKRLVREQAYRELCQRIESEGYQAQTEAGLKSFVDDILAGRLELRAYDKKIVHAKLYLFLPENWAAIVPKGTLITSSSNFTGPGLGTDESYNQGNYELNLERRDAATIQFAKAEFDRLWADSVELIPAEIAQVIRQKTFINQDIKPRDFYYRFLYEVFKDNLETEGQGIENFFPQGFKRLSYQIDAVHEGMALLERHNGFILADVVGLGKTVVSTILVLRWLAMQPKEARILVVAPPVLMNNWQRTFESFQLSPLKYRIISSGSLHKVDHPSRYALILVDEAHNFRNSNTEAYRNLEELCKKPGDIGIKKVILVSATPLNNRPSELLNLLRLFQAERDSSLGVRDLHAFFQDKQNRFDEAKKAGVDIHQAQNTVKEIYKEIREMVLGDITIRRTRSDLLDNRLYKKDLDDQGISFPEVQPPRPVPYYLDTDVDRLFSETLELLSNPHRLQYAYHRMLSYLTGSARDKFNLTEHTFVQLRTLLVQFFLKRLDSSFFAFKQSLARFTEDTATLLKMLNEGHVYYSNSIDVRQYIANEDIEGLEAEMENKRAHDPSITTLLPSDFTPDFHAHLHQDLQRLLELKEQWDKISEDPKLEEFANHLDSWLKKEKNPGERVVVFSESEETVIMIRDHLVAKGRTDVLAVSAANRNQTMAINTGDATEQLAVEELIRRNFDANYPARYKEDRYRVIVTTDVLSEGVSLHRANTIVNYDTPWNSVRLFQRIGRVNRVGSVAPKVYIYNFFPMSRVDDVIELKKKAQMKLQAFHSAFGEDAPIYSSEEEVAHFGMYGGDSSLAEDGPSPKLKLMLEIRELMLEHPTEYARIVALPAMARSVRRGVADPVVFLATGTKDLFYSLTGSDTCRIGLIEAANSYRAQADELAAHADLPWNDYIATAQAAYHRDETIKAQVQTGAKHYPPATLKALRYIGSFFNSFAELTGMSSEDLDLFHQAHILIERGTAPARLIAAIGQSEKNAFNLSEEAQASHLKELFIRFDIAHFEATPFSQNHLTPLFEPTRLVMIQAHNGENS